VVKHLDLVARKTQIMALDASTKRDDSTTPVTNLVPRTTSESPVETLRSTLDYATSPKSYMLRQLGQDLIDERSHLLSFPTEPLDKDKYGEAGVHKEQFEKHIAKLLGKTHGLFFITGVQAQLVALKVYCDAGVNNRVAWHSKSHLEIHEQRSYAETFNLDRILVGKSKLEVPTVEDIQAVTSLPADRRPAVILLELPNRELGCKTYPWEDLVQISKLCRAAGVKLHMDGARLWEVEPYYQHHNNRSFANLAELFDSVYVSFYKGLGAVCGAMLISSDETFMSTAKVWQRRMGGNMVTSYQEIIDCERGYNLNIGSFGRKYEKMKTVASAIMAATTEYRTAEGQPMVYFNPGTPHACQIHTHIQGASAEEVTAARDQVEKKDRIRVFASLRPWQNLDEQQNAKLVQRGDRVSPDEGALPEKEDPKDGPDDKHHYIEWMITDASLAIADETYAKGWRALCQNLTSEHSVTKTMSV